MSDHVDLTSLAGKPRRNWSKIIIPYFVIFCVACFLTAYIMNNQEKKADAIEEQKARASRANALLLEINDTKAENEGFYQKGWGEALYSVAVLSQTQEVHVRSGTVDAYCRGETQ